MSHFDALMDRWASDEQFREDFRADPEGTLRASDIELTDEEWETVRGVDVSALDDAELQERINKCG